MQTSNTMNTDSTKRNAAEIEIGNEESSGVVVNNNNDNCLRESKRPRSSINDQTLESTSKPDVNIDSLDDSESDNENDNNMYTTVEDMIAVPISFLFSEIPTHNNNNNNNNNGIITQQQFQSQSPNAKRVNKPLLSKYEAQCFLQINLLAKQIDSLASITSKILEKKMEYQYIIQKIKVNKNLYLLPLYIILQIIGTSIPNDCIQNIKYELNIILQQLQINIIQLRQFSEQNWTLALSLEYAGDAAQILAQAKIQLSNIQDEICCRIEQYVLKINNTDNNNNNSLSRQSVISFSMKDYCKRAMMNITAESENDDDNNVYDNADKNVLKSVETESNINYKNIVPDETPSSQTENGSNTGTSRIDFSNHVPIILNNQLKEEIGTNGCPSGKDYHELNNLQIHLDKRKRVANDLILPSKSPINDLNNNIDHDNLELNNKQVQIDNRKCIANDLTSPSKAPINDFLSSTSDTDNVERNDQQVQLNNRMRIVTSPLKSPINDLGSYIGKDNLELNNQRVQIDNRKQQITNDLTYPSKSLIKDVPVGSVNDKDNMQVQVDNHKGIVDDLTSPSKSPIKDVGSINDKDNLQVQVDNHKHIADNLTSPSKSPINDLEFSSPNTMDISSTLLTLAARHSTDRSVRFEKTNEHHKDNGHSLGSITQNHTNDDKQRLIDSPGKENNNNDPNLEKYDSASETQTPSSPSRSTTCGIQNMSSSQYDAVNVLNTLSKTSEWGQQNSSSSSS